MHFVCLLTDDVARARVRDGLRGRATVSSCAHVRELAALTSRECADVVMLAPWDAAGTPTAPVLRQLRREYPQLPIAVYCALDQRSAHELVTLAKAGADQVIVAGYDDEAAGFPERLIAAAASRAEAVTLEHLASSVPPTARPIMAYCLEHARAPLSVAAIASALGVNRKTLVYRLATARMPAPHTLIAWCRLLVAARLLQDPGRTVEQAAFAVRFSSGTGLRNMMRRYTGLRATEIRARGGLRCMLGLFEDNVLGGRRIEPEQTHGGVRPGRAGLVPVRRDEGRGRPARLTAARPAPRPAASPRGSRASGSGTAPPTTAA